MHTRDIQRRARQHSPFFWLARAHGTRRVGLVLRPGRRRVRLSSSCMRVCPSTASPPCGVVLSGPIILSTSSVFFRAAMPRGRATSHATTRPLSPPSRPPRPRPLARCSLRAARCALLAARCSLRAIVRRAASHSAPASPHSASPHWALARADVPRARHRPALESRLPRGATRPHRRRHSTRHRPPPPRPRALRPRRGRRTHRALQSS